MQENVYIISFFDANGNFRPAITFTPSLLKFAFTLMNEHGRIPKRNKNE